MLIKTVIKIALDAMLKTWDLAIRIVVVCRAYPVKLSLYIFGTDPKN
jgi:hypothetical protein